MAIKGEFYGTTTNAKVKPKITWSATQSVTGNYSDITATLSYSRTNSGYTTGGYWSGSLSIGDSTGTVSSKYIEITQDSDTVAIIHSARVYHDDYGKLSVTIAATGKIAGSSLTGTTISSEETLDTIARASTISAADANIESRATVVISRKNDAFTHSVAYQFGTLSGYIDADGNCVDTEVKLSATTLNFLLPQTFYYQIPDSPTGKCALTCRTYSDNTQIGENQTAEFTVTAAQSLCAPTVTGTVVDIDPKTVELTGNAQNFIRYCSDILCTIAVDVLHGASIVEKKIGGVVVDAESRTIENFTGYSVAFWAKDSRGYTASYYVGLGIYTVPYVILTNNAEIKRTDPTGGNAILTLKGNCYSGSFGEVDNALSIQYRVNNGDPITTHPQINEDHTYYVTIELSGLDYTQSHTIQVDACDELLEPVSKTLTLSKGIPVFDWGEEDFSFHVPVELPGLTINGQPLENYIRRILAES